MVWDNVRETIKEEIVLWYKRIQVSVSIWPDAFGGYNQNANTKRRAILSLGNYLDIFSFQNAQWYIIFLQLIDDKEPA